MDLQAKEKRLFEELGRYESLIVAYSGGVDSAYLAYASHQVLQNRVTAENGWGYGYQWRLGRAPIDDRLVELFFAAGRGGQHIIVVPSLRSGRRCRARQAVTAGLSG